MQIKKLLLTLGCASFLFTSHSALAASDAAPAKAAPPSTTTVPDSKKVMLEVTNSWARASVSSTRNSAAYMTIKNLTDQEYVLIGASSMDTANNVELHKSFVDEKGVSRMSSIDKLIIPAKTTVTMEPGGIHIMLMDLKSTLNVGDKINIDLRFEGKDPLTVSAEVK